VGLNRWCVLGVFGLVGDHLQGAERIGESVGSFGGNLCIRLYGLFNLQVDMERKRMDCGYGKIN
jgi:hypothetical protein